MLCVTSVGMHYIVGKKEIGSDHAVIIQDTGDCHCIAGLKIIYKKIDLSIFACNIQLYLQSQVSEAL